MVAAASEHEEEREPINADKDGVHAVLLLLLLCMLLIFYVYGGDGVPDYRVRRYASCDWGVSRFAACLCTLVTWHARVCADMEHPIFEYILGFSECGASLACLFLYLRCSNNIYIYLSCTQLALPVNWACLLGNAAWYDIIIYTYWFNSPIMTNLSIPTLLYSD